MLQTLALSFQGGIEEATHLTRIAEVAVTTQIDTFHEMMEGLNATGVEGEMSGCCHPLKDGGELTGTIVVETNGLGETTLEAWVGIDEVVHAVGITGYDADKLTSVVFQTFEQGVDGFGTKGI